MRESSGSMETFELYPTPSESVLKAEYVGKNLLSDDVNGPQAVLDLAVVKRNCKIMLETMKLLDLSFRAHVKTHKTIQVTRLQVGEAPNPVRLIVSTVAEAESLLPYLRQCLKEDRQLNILYGIPPSRTSIPRMLRIRNELGPGSIIFMIDNEDQLEELQQQSQREKGPILVFVKVDGGYSRAGLRPNGVAFSRLVMAISQKTLFKLYGFYCHHGSSYNVSGPEEALHNLKHEIETLLLASSRWSKLSARRDRLVISAGATPTATSAQNLLARTSDPSLMALFERVKAEHELEIHAGVYPFLDLQQLATHARPTNSLDSPTMNSSDIGFRILAEVLSAYEEREKPEMLVGAGSLALGREVCKSYAGWGIVAPSLRRHNGRKPTTYDERQQTGWIVGRIGQEHGILTWEGPKEQVNWFEIGEKVMIWPNHACIAGAGYGWYLVIDSAASDGETSKVVDVWARWRGW